MKILLVNPPNSGRSLPEEKYGLTSFQRIFKGEPLALETVAGGLSDHDLKILDLKVDLTPFSQVLNEFQPDLVALTGVTCEANTVLKLAEQTKRLSQALVVVGGIQATSTPDFFNVPQVDFVIIGLGKLSFKQLVIALEAGTYPTDLPGVAKTNPQGRINFIARDYSIDDLLIAAPPRYDLVDGYRPAYVLTSRALKVGYVSSSLGCPYRCNFCSVGPLTGHRFLASPPEVVVRDIGLLPDVPIIRLVDANTFANPDQAARLCQAIMDAGWRKVFIAEARADSIVSHPDLFARWAEAGLKYVVVGFEEVSESRLTSLEKRTTVAQNIEAARRLHQLDLTIVGDFIVSPDYTAGDFDTLEEFVVRAAIDIPMLTVLTPLPGTPLFERMKGEIVIPDLEYYTLTNAVIPTYLAEDDFYHRYAGLMSRFHAQAGM